MGKLVTPEWHKYGVLFKDWETKQQSENEQNVAATLILEGCKILPV